MEHYYISVVCTLHNMQPCTCNLTYKLWWLHIS